MSRPVLHVITDTSSALKNWFQRLLLRPDSIVVKHVLRRVCKLKTKTTLKGQSTPPSNRLRSHAFNHKQSSVRKSSSSGFTRKCPPKKAPNVALHLNLLPTDNIRKSRWQISATRYISGYIPGPESRNHSFWHSKTCSPLSHPQRPRAFSVFFVVVVVFCFFILAEERLQPWHANMRMNWL